MQDAQLSQLSSLHELLQKALKADEEIKLDTDYISDSYHEEVDRLRKIAYHSDELLMEYQQFLVQQTGITNVKLKYVMNQGYFVEVTTKDSGPFEKNIGELSREYQKIAENSGENSGENSLELSDTNSLKFSLSRRQTLKGNQRYSSPYLEHIQEDILSARAQLGKLEYEVL